jgi:Zn-dependent protease with chaperone function
MRLYLVAAGLLGLSVTCLGPGSSWLAAARWTSRAPRAAVVLWQAIGVTGAVAAIGAGLAVAVVRFGVGFRAGLGDLAAGLVDGHPLSGLGLPDALGLTLAADVAIVLATVVAITMVRTVRARARHRRVLDLVGIGSDDAAGALLLDHPRATAYCLPGIRPRIVVSAGALRLLQSSELAAVIEHERGHACEHHGLVMLPLTSLAEPLRWIPYARQAPANVALLLEMAADDYSARHHDRRDLARALVRMGTAMAAPECAFSAAGISVAARVQRLLGEDATSRAAATAAVCAASVLLLAPFAALLA